uniref:amino acid adenylation domain-containing protein n=1 Tax=Peterkaempfera griseoplana TaxID=66896 RepID=UPI000B2B5F12
YATDLFEEATAASLGARFVRVLETVAADPAIPVHHIEVMDTAERHQVLVDWNDTAHQVPTGTIVDLFEAQVTRTPDATAVIDPEGAEISYAELNKRANRLARLLIEHGAGPEDRVGVLMPRSPGMVVALLAVLKSGAAYIPLDPQYPAERIAYMLDDARPTVLLTMEALAPSELDGRMRVIALNASLTRGRLTELSDTDVRAGERRAALRSENPAYLIYTSGSTGRPKGVVIPHRALLNYASRTREAYPALAQSTLIHFSVSFDAGVTAFYGALVSGGCLHLAPADTHLPVAPTKARPAFLKATPSHLAFLDQDGLGGNVPTRQLMLGGESLHAVHLEQLRREHPQLAVVNHYGPTEATVGAVDHHVAPGEPLQHGPVPIGRPMWNMQVYVLDAGLNPCPPGVPGELYLAGAQLARGYLGRADLTAGRFVANPFGPAGSRMYRSGDLARWNTHGLLEHLGRTDDQVKLRGFRIELGEVRTAVSAHPGVAQVAVVVREDRPGDKRITAYVVPGGEAARTDTADLVAELRGHTAALLPDYMVPSAFVVLDALPVTENGKLDNRALPAPEPRGIAGGRKPATEREAVLCSLFAEILAAPEVNVDDNFFELGGHSLLAITLIERIRTALGIDIPISALFATPTPGELANRSDSHLSDAVRRILLPIRTSGEAEPFFCVHPATGVAWGYSPLLRFMPAQHPLYGLQARGIDGSDVPLPGSIREMAAEYVQQIRTVQPSGPYHLVGWSSGGVVAQEMAVQLQSAGEEVAALVMMDAFSPSERAKAIEAYTAGGIEIEDAIPGSELLPELTEEEYATVLRVTDNMDAISPSHQPEVFRGDLLFLTAEFGKPEGIDTAASWARYTTGKIAEVPIPCRHAQMSRPDMLGRAWTAIADWLHQNQNQPSAQEEGSHQ